VKNVTDAYHASPLAALINVGLAESDNGLTEQQLRTVTLLIDLGTGHKKYKNIGVEDYRWILEEQGYDAKQISQFELL
jgi:hypothetical protein